MIIESNQSLMETLAEQLRPFHQSLSLHDLQITQCQRTGRRIAAERIYMAKVAVQLGILEGFIDLLANSGCR
ncbi:hypothetical protein D1872_296770 [compost metagenome]